jgi:CrcB protein
LVLIGGGMGALARYITATLITQRYGVTFPWGTFVVNITGSFAIGLLMTLFTQRVMHPYWRLLLVVGFLGGYTTFSSFEYETLQAVRSGARWIGLLNAVCSVIMGYIAVWLGTLIGGGK